VREDYKIGRTEKNGEGSVSSPTLREISVEDNNTKSEILMVTLCNEVFCEISHKKCTDSVAQEEFTA
jgi:hypothetical protein